MFDQPQKSRRHFLTMKLSEIAKILEAEILVGNDQSDSDITTCGASDLMSDILAGLSEGCVVLTGLTTVQVIKTALVASVEAVVFVRGKKVPKDVADLASAQNLPILISPYSMFVSCGRLFAAGITGLDGKR